MSRPTASEILWVVAGVEHAAQFDRFVEGFNNLLQEATSLAPRERPREKATRGHFAVKRAVGIGRALFFAEVY